MHGGQKTKEWIYWKKYFAQQQNIKNTQLHFPVRSSIMLQFLSNCRPIYFNDYKETVL